MRSYFNKPSWASRGDENGDSEFYRRAGQTYNDIVATNKSTRERQASSSRRHSHKRQRLSSPSNDEDTQRSNIGEQGTSTERTTPLNNSSLPQEAPQGSTRCVGSSTAQQALISHESPTMDTRGLIPPTPQNSREGKVPGLRANPPSSPSGTISDGKVDAHIAGSSVDTRAPAETGASRGARSTAYDNTVVQILITSKIPKTKPLIIHRKMSQSLKGVRLAWCTHQNLPEELHSTVFLTWKGRRLFDVTTCRSLNIEVHSAFTKELLPFDDCFSETDDCRIHMEAVTEETFAVRYRSSPNMVGSDPIPLTSTESQDAERDDQSEIILKCPGFDEFKIRVSLTTHISRVVAAFREARSISPGLLVYLAFDGDRLDPQSSLADYEITDGDLVDVLVKKPI
ncbi:ubiquitin-2 like Rad60 SUMO-like-domain-containing protein [Aspergillus varians]